MVSSADTAVAPEPTADEPTSGQALDSSARRKRKKSTVKTFDFRRPSKFNRDHFRAFQVVHETFARQVTTLYSTSLRAPSQCTLLEIEQLSYGEYVSNLPNPAFLSIFQLDPLPGYSLLCLPLPVGMNAVEFMLGGTGHAGDVEVSAPTEIETNLMRDFTVRGLHELVYAHESLYPVEPRLMQVETNPQFAQIAAATDMMLVIRYELKIGEVSGEVSMCIPANSLNPVLEEITGSHFSDKPTADILGLRAAVGDQLSSAVVQVRVEFNEVSLASGEIINLQVGDVLPLEHKTDEPLQFLVEGEKYLYAMPGKRGKRLAVQVVDYQKESR